MIQRRFYLPEQLYTRLQLVAKQSNKTVTQAVREFVEKGIEDVQKKRAGESTRSFLKIAEQAEREDWGKAGPFKLAKKLDQEFVEAWYEQHPYMKPPKKHKKE